MKDVFSGRLIIGESECSSYYSPDTMASLRNLKCEDRPWTREEDRTVWGLCNWPGPTDWDIAMRVLPGRSEEAITSRFLDYVQPQRQSFKPEKVRSFSKWSKEEDVKALMTCEGDVDANWDVVSRILPGRTPNQVKSRYLNHLRPWTAQEKDIIALHIKQGSSLKILVPLLPRHKITAISAERKRHSTSQSCDD